MKNDTEDAIGRRTENGRESRGASVGAERGGGALGSSAINSADWFAMVSLFDGYAIRAQDVANMSGRRPRPKQLSS